MPVIIVHSSKERGPHLAAAVMAVTLARLSQPLRTQSRHQQAKYEKTRPNNPNRLTINQHVFPLMSMARFSDQSGRVSVHDLRRGKTFRAKPTNPLFQARRAWDQQTESVYMKRIEDKFQKAVVPIIDGKLQALPSEAKAAVDAMYALWHIRARLREIDSQEFQLNEVRGANLTKEQEENLEANGYLFVRESGKIPSRQLNGAELQMRTGDFVRELENSVGRWGVISTQSGEFIVPDVPMNGVIPLTPQLALIQSAPDGMITEKNLAEVNFAMRARSEDYFFSRGLLNCPFF